MAKERQSDWSDAELRAVATFVRDRAGLVFGGSRIGSAEDGMRRTMARFGIQTTGELRRRVSTSDGVRDALLDELTVGETYFFREPRQLDRVRRTLVNLAAAPERRGVPLRLWSAGCASGEEPYSLAIILREEHLAHDATVIGTDVAVARLAAARRARYSRWALRGVSDDRIEKYFSREGKHFVLAERIRRMVDFQSLNLVGDAPLPPEISNMDVVLCRNVLIYMDLAAISRIATRLLDALSTDGWLFLGASDPPLASLVDCEAVATPEGLAYRRLDPRRSSPRPVLASPVPLPEARLPSVAVEPVAVPLADLSPTPAARSATPTAIARDVSNEGDEAAAVADVRSLSNAGNLHAAADACVAALERHPMSPELAYLQAVILAQLGHLTAAATAARRALYLDRSFVLAHLVLGETLARSGYEGRARRSFQNAVDLLESAPADAVVMGGEGELAARFLRIGLSRLKTLTSNNSSNDHSNNSQRVRRST